MSILEEITKDKNKYVHITVVYRGEKNMPQQVKLLELNGYTHFVVADEVDHYHWYLKIPLTTNKKGEPKEIKENLRNLIKDKFQPEKYDRLISRGKKKGLKETVSRIGIKMADTERAIVYTVKDKNYEYRGFTEEQMQVVESLSYKKGNAKLADELEKIRQSYLQGDFDAETLYERILLANSQYNRNIYYNHIDAKVNSIIIQRDPSHARTIAERRVERLFNS